MQNQDISEQNDVEAGRNQKTTSTAPENRGPIARNFRTFTRALITGRAPSPVAFRALKRARRDILKRNSELHFDIDKIFKVTQHYHLYENGPTKLTGLAKFDDMTQYGLPDSAEKDFLKAEIDRLVAVAKTLKPINFHSGGAFSKTNAKGFQGLSDVADQILSNFAIIRQDNSLHALQYCPTRAEIAIEHFLSSRRALIARFQEEDSPVQGGQPKILEDEKDNKKAYFALVDFISNCVVRLLVRSAFSFEHYWDRYIIAILATWSAKLKVISYDPTANARQSITNGDLAIQKMAKDERRNEALIVHVPLGKESKDKAEVSTLETQTDISTMYYEEHIVLRYYLEKIFRHCCFALFASEKIGGGAACFDVCNVIYETGFENILTVVCSDRDGDIAASSEASNVKCTWTALELLHANTQEILGRNSRSVDSGIATDIQWDWHNNPNAEPQGGMQTSSIDELVSILVPLALASPWTAVFVDDLIRLSSSGTDDKDPILQFEFPKDVDCRSRYSVCTQEFTLLGRRYNTARYQDCEVVGLARSPFLKGLKAGVPVERSLTVSAAENSASAHSKPQTALPVVTKALENTNHLINKNRRVENLPQHLEESNEMSHTLKSSFRGFLHLCCHFWQHHPQTREKQREKLRWLIITEDSVWYPCKRYVWSILVICLIWILGGMAVPFLVGEQIRGVDPFQITTFMWVIAAFFIVIAKSRYVSDWPWHEFLHAKVSCRSVSEVNDVTGVDPQTILMHLLYEEERNILRTKGPYNSMFSRKVNDSGGFSIDVPLQLSTMLESGFIILKVRNESGEHLVCLDVRSGAAAAVSGVMEKILASKDVSKDNSRDSSKAAIPGTASNLRGRRSQVEGEIGESLIQGNAEVATDPKPVGTIEEVQNSKYWFRRETKVKEDQPEVLSLKEVELRYSKVLGVYVMNSSFG